ncbi:glycosyltransferase [Rhodococcus corynebacterioides]|nr:glycosyltransferase [Rhodococcus corynebacterioides]
MLVSAYACEPGRGSEPGVGWEWTRTIAELSDVTLLTRTDGQKQILRQHFEELGISCCVVALATPFDAGRGFPGKTYVRYMWWVLKARRTARSLAEVNHFDLVHHVTYASDWLPAPRLANRPFIWGPVGGSSYAPKDLYRYLSYRQRAADLLRKTIGRIFRRTVTRKTIKQANVALALNEDTANELRRCGATDVRIEPNALLELESFSIHETNDRGERPKKVVFAGRLLEWKGVQIAIRALALADTPWELHVLGDGPYRASLEKLAQATGVHQRVVFHGNVSRELVLRSLASADVYIHPSIHDSSPWSVAEAAAMGLPVLCFEVGGGAKLAGTWSRLISTSNPMTSINTHVKQAPQRPSKLVPSTPWDRDRVKHLLACLYEELL